MTTILNDICDYKKQYIKSQKTKIPISVLKKEIDNLGETRNFKLKIDNNFKKNKISVIAEIKKASPSKGIIKKDFFPVQIAKMYELGNATCISILTDIKYFMGSNEILQEVRRNSSLPILRKDFVLTEYQVYETRAIGADCILLIHSILEIEKLKMLVDLSKSLGLDILIEVHNKQELLNVIDIKGVMIGINNRNLRNMNVDLNNSMSLLAKAPENFNIVCESGIDSLNKLKSLIKNGFNSFLIGEYLMKSEKPNILLQEIFKCDGGKV